MTKLQAYRSKLAHALEHHAWGDDWKFGGISWRRGYVFLYRHTKTDMRGEAGGWVVRCEYRRLPIETAIEEVINSAKE